MSTIERKRRERIERIFDAAAREFAAHGFHATRMEDIAAALDLQKGSLYYYFESKEDLLTKLVEERVGAALDALREIVTGGGPPSERVRSAVRSHLTVFQEHADVYTIFNTERLSSISGDVAAVVDDKGREYETLWRSLIEEGVAAGEFQQDVDVPIVVKAAMGMCNGTLTWLRPEGRFTIGEVADRFADILIHGIRASAPPTSDSRPDG